VSKYLVKPRASMRACDNMAWERHFPEAEYLSLLIEKSINAVCLSV